MVRSLMASMVLISVLLVGLSGCDPVPARTLSTEEKLADLAWIYSQFGENYAPLEYKERKYGFNFGDLKAETNEAAKATSTNDEFYKVVFQFVSKFRDAHSSAALTNASLPNRAMVAYLGFSGSRDGDVLVVKDRLPTISDTSHYPIEKDDQILKIDGRDLRTAVNADLVPWRNLGSDEANFTYHANKLFTRVSTLNGLPSMEDVVLTVKRGDQTFDVTLPWIKKDVFQFQEEQSKAKKEVSTKETAAESEKNFLMLADGSGGVAFKFRFIGFDGRIELPALTVESISKSLRKTVTDGFRFIDSFAAWELVEAKEISGAEKSPEQNVRERRYIPDDSVFLNGSKTYPTYVSRDPKGLVATVYLDTFSPATSEPDTVKEFKDMLTSLQTLGVDRIIIDMINNGGGSLSLGFQLAQSLSSERVALPGMQFRVSDSWLDQFETQSMEADNDSEREVSRRAFDALRNARGRGDRLSPVLSASVLAPFAIVPNAQVKTKFRVVLLVNEMCASMCDIFSAMLQDAGMAKVVGTQTMGAGGNVVNYNQAPNSHYDVRQTESLIVRKDGTYLENIGVKPDVLVPVANYASTKYKEVREAALKVFD